MVSAQLISSKPRMEDPSHPTDALPLTSRSQPSQADIRRRNAAFVQKAQSGRSPVKAAKKEKPNVGLWVVAGIGILLVGSSKYD
jgi:hypothetical protein